MLEDVVSGLAARRAQARFPLLTQHRVVSITDGSEIAAACEAIISAGWCVDNDAYLFPADGGWLGYVGHHGDLTVDMPSRAD